MSELPTAASVAARRRALADGLRASGAIRSDLLCEAFAAVSRHLFVPVVYRDADGQLVPQRLTDAGASAFDLVYRDNTLVTSLDDAGRPVSSSTAPSVMAFMLEALALRPGLRVLEIGCGTGYNAAVMHKTTGCEVVTVDPRPAQVAQARLALERHGLTGVTCVVADGYDVVPDGAPFDRIIATCAVAGIPPAWIGRSTRGARLVAPLAHGGIDMLVRADVGDDAITARPIGGAGYFINAQGHLYPAPRRPRLEPFGEPHIVSAAPVPGYRNGYHDMWFAAAVADPRVTSVLLTGNDIALGQCGLADADSAAVLRTDGKVVATGVAAPVLAELGVRLATDWVSAGRPRARSWQTTLRPLPNAARPLLIAGRWHRGQA